ncbi:MAG: CsbD family protein [Haloechinothrix sp.]
MSASDKFENKAEDLGGKAKETVGKATGDERLEGEGKADQAKAGLKSAAQHVKDAAEKIKGVFKR